MQESISIPTIVKDGHATVGGDGVWFQPQVIKALEVDLSVPQLLNLAESYSQQRNASLLANRVLSTNACSVFLNTSIKNAASGNFRTEFWRKTF